VDISNNKVIISPVKIFKKFNILRKNGFVNRQSKDNVKFSIYYTRFRKDEKDEKS